MMVDGENADRLCTDYRPGTSSPNNAIVGVDEHALGAMIRPDPFAATENDAHMRHESEFDQRMLIMNGEYEQRMQIFMREYEQRMHIFMREYEQRMSAIGRSEAVQVPIGASHGDVRPMPLDAHRTSNIFTNGRFASRGSVGAPSYTLDDTPL
jgi:hypothetical protein